ncbi:histidine kinase [Nostoc linckia]|nr:histidine kinase [Nostoc linckia]
MGRWGDEFFPSAPCPMPNAQCPMPNDQCPMPNAQCPMPYFSSHKSIDFDS